MKAFTIDEMENVFEIGRTMQAMCDLNEIEIDDSKEAFYFALRLAIEFEKQNPEIEEYYIAIDDFVTAKIAEEFKVED